MRRSGEEQGKARKRLSLLSAATLRKKRKRPFSSRYVFPFKTVTFLPVPSGSGTPAALLLSAPQGLSFPSRRIISYARRFDGEKGRPPHGNAVRRAPLILPDNPDSCRNTAFFRNYRFSYPSALPRGKAAFSRRQNPVQAASLCQKQSRRTPFPLQAKKTRPTRQNRPVAALKSRLIPPRPPYLRPP